MGIEIEHKFLVRDDRWRQQVERSARLRQGYLTSDARCSVRVRVAGDQGFLNIKSGTLGIQRSEYEYAIPLAEAPALSDDELIERFVEEFEAEIMPEPDPASEETT